MNEKLNTLNHEIHRIRLLAFACIAILAVSLVLLLMHSVLFSPLLIAVSAFYLFVVRRMMKRYQMHVGAATLEESFRPYLKQITYAEKDGLPRKEIAECGLIPVSRNDSSIIRSTVKGTSMLRSVCISDVTVSYETPYINGNGKKKKTGDFLSGCYFCIALPEPSPHSFWLWDKELTGSAAQELFFEGKLNITSAQAAELRNQFLAFTEETQAFPIPEDFVKAFLRLANYTPGTLAARVEKGRLQVFIRNRFLYTRTVPVRTDLTIQILQSNPFPELSYLIRLADAIH